MHSNENIDYDLYIQKKTTSKIQTFCNLKFSKIIFKLRYVFFILGIINYCINLSTVFTIEITTAPDAILKESHPIEKARIWAK